MAFFCRTLSSIARSTLKYGRMLIDYLRNTERNFKNKKYTLSYNSNLFLHILRLAHRYWVRICTTYIALYPELLIYSSYSSSKHQNTLNPLPTYDSALRSQLTPVLTTHYVCVSPILCTTVKFICERIHPYNIIK